MESIFPLFFSYPERVKNQYAMLQKKLVNWLQINSTSIINVDRKKSNFSLTYIGIAAIFY